MAKTKKRPLKNRKLNKRRKSIKYNMKGCYHKKCKKCNRVHSGKHQSGGCACQTGGNSVGILQNITNIGRGFGDSLLGVYNGFNAVPQSVSSNPTAGHFQHAAKFKY